LVASFEAGDDGVRFLALEALLFDFHRDLVLFGLARFGGLPAAFFRLGTLLRFEPNLLFSLFGSEL
jgi:hypothetical protein